jgi:hypothetical protein
LVLVQRRQGYQSALLRAPNEDSEGPSTARRVQEISATVHKNGHLADEPETPSMTQILEGEQFEERLCLILDRIVQDPTLERACRAAGYSGKYVWTMLKRSGDGDPRYLVRWPDRQSGQRIQFGDAIALARRLHTVKFDHTLRSAVDVGIPIVQTFQGAVCWEQDAALLAEWGGDNPESKETAERIGGVKDYPYKHRIGASGKLERIALEVYQPAPGALRQHVARSLMPGSYNPPENRSIATEHSGRVLILNASRPAYAKDYTPDTPIKRDLQQRLADLRAKGPEHKHATDAQGHKVIPKIGLGSTANDPPERNGYGPLPQIDADGHPVGVKVKNMIGRDGKPAPGGYSMITGKPTG